MNMSYADYTASLYGDRDLGNYSPIPIRTDYEFKYRNDPDVILKDSAGRILKADIIATRTTHSYTGSQTMQVNNRTHQTTVSSNSPLAIIAIPTIYGNHQETGLEEDYKYMAGCVTNFYDIECYDYFIVSLNAKSIDFDTRNTQIYSGKTQYVWGVAGINSLRLNPPVSPGGLAPVYDSRSSHHVITRSPIYTVAGTKMDSFLDGLVNFNGSSITGVRYKAITQEFGRYRDSVLIEWAGKNGIWRSMEGSVYDNIRVVQWQGFDSRSYSNPIGCSVASGLPIFTLNNYDQLINYFQGKEWISDNDTNPPPSDWSTDWDIYVRGAGKPDIWIEMKSDKLDSWLDSEENKSGIDKRNIEVELRIRKDKNGNPPADDYELENWKKSKYDERVSTSYNEISRLTNSVYFDANESVGAGGIETLPNDFLLPYYAEWEFRIKYGKYSSNWCWAKIGVIGSPSVPDFSYMRNIGEQTDYGFTDSSTVTIHYDEYPPGYNPYDPPQKPSDPGIIGGDTLPSTPTGPNGLGLLTATYMLTESQCKELGDFFWNQDIFDKIRALNTSPLENVVSIKMIPYSVIGQPAQLVIGNVNTNINADKITTAPLYSVGDIEYRGRYGSFLDHHPYTTAQIFLPYIGFVPIDPYIFTNKQLHVDYAFDLVTGQCKAMLSVDRIYFANYTGQCGIDIPLVNGTRAALEASLITTIGGLALSPLSSGASASAVLGGVSSLVGSEFHTQRTGGVSPSTNLYETRMCYIVIDSADANYPRSFAHDYGFPCLATYSLSQLSGFTKCEENVDVSGISGATNAEKEEIKSILTRGIYL